MLIKTMMLAAVITATVMMPARAEQAQSAEPGLIQSNTKEASFKYVSKHVKNIQRKLIKSGYSPGDIDGIFGPNTSRAIIQYQKNFGLPQSGFPDTRFIDHLNQGPPEKPQ